MPARQSGSPRQQCSEAISAFVDSRLTHHDPWVKNYFSFHSLAKVRGSKSRNELKQQYHTLVEMSAVITEML